MSNQNENLRRFQEIANRGVQDRLPQEKKAIFDEAVRRGLVSTTSTESPGFIKSALIGIGDGLHRFKEGAHQALLEAESQAIDGESARISHEQPNAPDSLSTHLSGMSERNAKAKKEVSDNAVNRRELFDSTEVGQSVPGKIGSTIGEVAPSFLIPGGTGKTVASRLAGNVAGNAAASSLTFVDEESGETRAGNTLTGAAFGVLPTGVEKLVPGAKNAARSLFRSGSAEKVVENIDNFAEVGAKPTVGLAGGSSLAQGLESISSKFFGGRVIREAVEETTEKVKARLGDIASDISSKSDDISAAGRVIKEGIVGDGGFVSRFREKEARLWGAVDARMNKDAPIDLSKTRDALSGIVKDDSLGEFLTPSRLRTLNDAISGNAPYQRVKELRTFIGESLSSTSTLLPDTSRGNLKHIYSALSDDIKVAAENASAISEFNRANRFTRASRKRVDEFVDRIAKRVDPDDIFKMVSRGSESASTINAVKRSLKSEEWEVVASNVIRRLGRSNSGAQDAAGSAFSVDKFLTDWDKLGKAKNALLSGSPKLNKYRDNLDRIAQISESMKGASRELSNVSGSGVFAANAGTLGGIVTALSLGNVQVGAAFVALVATNKGAAELMTNSQFVNWLAQSSKVKPARLSAHISRLASIASASSEADALAINELLSQLEQQTNSVKE